MKENTPLASMKQAERVQHEYDHAEWQYGVARQRLIETRKARKAMLDRAIESRDDETLRMLSFDNNK